MKEETTGDKEIQKSGGLGDAKTGVEEDKIEKRPLFDEGAGEEGESLKKEKRVSRKTESDDEKNESANKNEEEPAESESIEDIESPSHRKNLLKWGIIGGGGFVAVLVLAFFFASLYLHKKEAVLNRGKSARVAIQPVVRKEKRIVIREYTLQPFFLRLKSRQAGEDKFLSAQIYIEFVRKELPEEIHLKREILRTLIYKLLLKYFGDGKDSPKKEKKFEQELIPALNTFFKGGGVYNIGFKELVIR